MFVMPITILRMTTCKPHAFSMMQEAVDIFGLSAVDRLFCFMIVRELQNFLKYLQRNLMKTDSFVKQLKMFVKATEDPNALISMYFHQNTVGSDFSRNLKC